MGFENFFNQVSETVDGAKKKVVNVAKIASIAAVGLMPVGSLAAEKGATIADDKKIEDAVSGKKIKMDSAFEIIKSDVASYMVSEKSYYLSQFPELNEEDIDSLIARAEAERDSASAKAEKIEISPEKLAEDSMNREVSSVLYPDQARDILNGGRFIPPSDWIIAAYKAGEFKTRAEFLQKRDALSEVYNK